MSADSSSPAFAERLLVVDDDENNRDMLSRRLMRRGFTVDVAADGYQALEVIRNPDQPTYDLVLLDIEMPGLSGFDVLTQVRQTHPATTLPIVIATARHDREDIVKALGLGANDYVTKPIDFPVVLARVETQLTHKRAVDRILALEADVRRHNAELEKANARMRHSLELAAQVQKSLLPGKSPLEVGTLQFAWRFDPCDELGGDIFDAFPLPGGQIGFYLLDVSGHGVPAALLSVTLSRLLGPTGAPSLVEALGQDGKLIARPPADVVGELNRRFPLTGGTGQYFTMFYGLFDCVKNHLRYVSAGHPPALRVADDGHVSPLGGANYAVGWFPEEPFDEYDLTLGPGERIVLYSDGITETMDPAGRHFGVDGLAAALSRGRGQQICEQIDGLMQDVIAFRADGEVRDDVTILALECDCPQAPKR